MVYSREMRDQEGFEKVYIHDEIKGIYYIKFNFIDIFSLSWQYISQSTDLEE